MGGVTGTAAGIPEVWVCVADSVTRDVGHRCLGAGVGVGVADGYEVRGTVAATSVSTLCCCVQDAVIGVTE